MTLTQLSLFLLFAILNLAILTKIKAKNDLIIATIASHLIIILLFSITIGTIEILQELVLAVAAYSLSTLFLISQDSTQKIAATKLENSSKKPNAHPIQNHSHQQIGPQILQRSSFGATAFDLWSKKLPNAILAGLICFVLMAGAAIILVIHEVPQINNRISAKRSQRQKDSAINPLILPSHPVHITIKKFYLGKKFNDSESRNVAIALEKSELKRIKLQNELSKQFLLKRSSEILLITVFLITGLLALSRANQA